MNTSMWHHPFTAKHLQVLESVLDYKIIQPISKKLACGDTGKDCVGMSHWKMSNVPNNAYTIGIGAMAESQYISDYVLEMIDGKVLAGLTVEDVNK